MGQIKSNRPRIETILHTVLKFQFDRACFQREEANANFGVSDNIAASASATWTRLSIFHPYEDEYKAEWALAIIFSTGTFTVPVCFRRNTFLGASIIQSFSLGPAATVTDLRPFYASNVIVKFADHIYLIATAVTADNMRTGSPRH